MITLISSALISLQDMSDAREDQLKRELVGMVVLTRYNNRTYRICGIDREKTPRSVFTPGAKFNENAPNNISFIDYYRETYSVDIQDEHQPLLIATSSNFERKQKSHKLSLIPELCYITGLTPSMYVHSTL